LTSARISGIVVFFPTEKEEHMSIKEMLTERLPGIIIESVMDVDGADSAMVAADPFVLLICDDLDIAGTYLIGLYDQAEWEDGGDAVLWIENVAVDALCDMVAKVCDDPSGVSFLEHAEKELWRYATQDGSAGRHPSSRSGVLN